MQITAREMLCCCYKLLEDKWIYSPLTLFGYNIKFSHRPINVHAEKGIIFIFALIVCFKNIISSITTAILVIKLSLTVQQLSTSHKHFTDQEQRKKTFPLEK